MAGEAQRLLGAETQIAAAYEAVTKQRDRTLLQWRAKVDQHVAAQDQLRFAEDRIGNQIVRREDHIATPRFVEFDMTVTRMEIIGQRGLRSEEHTYELQSPKRISYAV